MNVLLMLDDLVLKIGKLPFIEVLLLVPPQLLAVTLTAYMTSFSKFRMKISVSDSMYSFLGEIKLDTVTV